jgi:pimeloyl-ACP methyl ester carboxylesterase
MTQTTIDLTLPDGRRLRAYDTGPKTGSELVVMWHHGTPNIGHPPEPLFDASARLGIRWLGYDRPGYGGSTVRSGRDIASAAADAARVADAAGVERFAVMGHSGGGPHALACAALLPDRVLGVVSGAGLAPYDAVGLDWFAGMAPSGVASLRAALHGRDAKLAHERAASGGDIGFVEADLAALEGPWSWFGSVVGPALAGGLDGLVDDDIAYVTGWGFDPASVTAPTLVLHGARDRIVPSAHGEWLAASLPAAELWLRPDDGHISVLAAAEDALAWLRDRAGGAVGAG